MDGQRGSQIDRELYRQLHRELRKEELERERIMNSENVSKENMRLRKRCLRWSEWRI